MQKILSKINSLFFNERTVMFKKINDINIDLFLFNESGHYAYLSGNRNVRIWQRDDISLGAFKHHLFSLKFHPSEEYLRLKNNQTANRK